MLGGALGSGARFTTNALFERWLGAPAISAATLAVNVAGCFLITAIAELATAEYLSPQTRLFLNVGIMGGLTTYSTFNQVLIEHLRDNRFGPAFLNMALTLGLCLGAGFLGLVAARVVTVK